MDFYQFQRTHNAFGPKQIWSRRRVIDAGGIDPLATEAMTNDYDKAVSGSIDGNGQEINQ